MIRAHDEEFRIQAAFVTYLELAHPDLLYTISPGGFIMSAGMAMKMMRMGYRKGTPDILFFEPRGPYSGLLVEMKKPGGTVSPEQEKFLTAARDRGYSCAVCFSKSSAISVLDKYLSLGGAV
jgi:hypothetical protein